MLLVVLENCGPCEKLLEKCPGVPFVRVPRKVENTDKDVFEVKKALGRLGIREFPVLLNNDMTEVLPLSLIDPDLK